MKTIVVLIFLSFSIYLHAENPDSTKAKIYQNKSIILEAAHKFDINPVYLASIIYVERSYNFSWTDIALDELIAKRGFNSSVGFCQVKIKTAYWIETQITDSLSSFFPRKKYINSLKLSKSPDELFKKLSNDGLNIYYAAAYLRIMQSFWEKSGYSIDKKPGILGTLYSIGLFHNNGKPRKPHTNPMANWFGREVIKSIFLLKHVFE
ncbi:MAG: hypothetical protein D8M58_21440 [Calditrichaeota bacterium]|nr:MAG: hypothetical protein DWQ03_00165 [Calditrichota bacterium]MBL1207978.1 hypothetical protein [Calditrichota bacterium]NOG47814.1 hypothetical protein [Calditrichota bacterium]